MSSGSLALASARQARLFAQAAGTVGSEFGHERARERERERVEGRKERETSCAPPCMKGPRAVKRSGATFRCTTSVLEKEDDFDV